MIFSNRNYYLLLFTFNTQKIIINENWNFKLAFSTIKWAFIYTFCLGIVCQLTTNKQILCLTIQFDSSFPYTDKWIIKKVIIRWNRHKIINRVWIVVYIHLPNVYFLPPNINIITFNQLSLNIFVTVITCTDASKYVYNLRFSFYSSEIVHRNFLWFSNV